MTYYEYWCSPLLDFLWCWIVPCHMIILVDLLLKFLHLGMHVSRHFPSLAHTCLSSWCILLLKIVYCCCSTFCVLVPSFFPVCDNYSRGADSQRMLIITWSLLVFLVSHLVGRMTLWKAKKEKEKRKAK